MSYGKKDEDADQAIVKVDRTAVFQEGMCQVVSACIEPLLTVLCSAVVQLLSRIASKMSYPPDQDCTSPLHRGAIPHQ